MGKRLEDIFNECYERVRSGERMESVLASYPEHAAELERLLRTAFDIGRRGSYIQPRPEFRYWAGVRLQGAFEYARRQKQRPAARGFNWSTAWAVALTAIVIVVVSGISTAAAASNAMPDGALYPLKLATEQARLALTFSESAKAELYAKMAERRVIELETMAEQGKIEAAAIAAEKLANQLETASVAITKMTEVPQPAATVTTPTAEPSPPAEELSGEKPAQSTETPAGQPSTEGTATTAAPASETTTQVTEKTVPEKSTKAERAERIRTALENSTTRSLTVLQKAMDEASPESKDRLQKVMDRLSERGYRKHQHRDDHQSQKQEGVDERDANPQQEPSPPLKKAPEASQQPGNSSKPSGQPAGPRNHGR